VGEAAERPGAAARRYHNGTKHSAAKLQTDQHYLDWEIKPHPFKIYPTIEPIALPRDGAPLTVPGFTAISASGAVAGGSTVAVPSLAVLARILQLSAGITRTKVLPDGEEYYFRAAACTGALYHIDLYVICADLPGLAAGVYHFGPHNAALHPLRRGDYRGVLVEATASEPAIAHAPVTIACASTYWRNAWKYQARTYRHCFWDTGTILANLLAVSAAERLPTRLGYGFVDDTVGTLLDLDPQREAPLALVALGWQPSTPRPQPPPAPVHFETAPLSSREVDYPAIQAVQAASSLATPADVAAWRTHTLAPSPAPAASSAEVALHAVDAAALPTESIDRLILRRGSTRQFAPRPIAFEQLSTLLQVATPAGASDVGGSTSELYLIVNAVEGLAPGTYVYQPDGKVLQRLRAGTFRREAGFLGLGQELPADAAVDIYLLCDLDLVYGRLGNRGYRVAQLDAALIGGRIYLAAYGLRLGATGLTFFDDDVTEFFSPHAAGKSVMFLAAVGHGQRAPIHG